MENEITRRDLLKKGGGLASLAIFGLTSSACASTKKFVNELIEKKYEIPFSTEKQAVDYIYDELPNYVHMVTTTYCMELDDKPLELPKFQGMGIVLNGKYLTMAHIMDIKDFTKKLNVKMADSIKKILKITLQEKNLIKAMNLDYENDVAIFDLPDDLKIKDFPCKSTNKLNYGGVVYTIGHAHWKGEKVRKDYISSLNEGGICRNCFTINSRAFHGDSGCPVVALKYEKDKINVELTGLIYGGIGKSLVFVKKIGEFIKHL